MKKLEKRISLLITAWGCLNLAIQLENVFLSIIIFIIAIVNMIMYFNNIE